MPQLADRPADLDVIAHEPNYGDRVLAPAYLGMIRWTAERRPPNEER